jgi:shikimate kinase
MEGKAFCYGAATIINGLATGMGAAFGIGLITHATVKLTNEPGEFKVFIEGDESENIDLAKQCVYSVLARFGLEKEHGASITTKSDIPISRDLGVDASLKAKVTLTGAYDDSCATYFGNVAVTDNSKRKLILQYPIKENFEVIIHVPKYKIRKSDVDISRLLGNRDAFQKAHDLALREEYLTAIRINGLTYGTAMGLDTKIITAAMDAGAHTAGITGTGPATVILAKPDFKEDIISALAEYSSDNIICTTLNNQKAGFE